MKIAIVDPASHSLPYDFYYIDALLEQGHDITFFCSTTAYNATYPELLANRQACTVKLYPISRTQAGRFRGALAYARLLFTLLFTMHRYDRIHFFWSILPILELPLFTLLQRKLVFTFHNDVPHGYAKRVYRPFGRLYALCKKVHFVSPSTMQHFMQRYRPDDPTKAVCLNHGLLPLLPADPVFNRRGMEKCIIFWGNVKAYKGIETVVRMCESGYFRAYRFEVYGKWDPELHAHKETLLRYGATVDDRFLPLEELQILMRRDAVFILPYATATQSGVAYTLLYYKRTFIASDRGDNAALLRNMGLDALLFDPDELTQIVSALQYCSEHFEAIGSRLEEGKKRFAWTKVMANALSLYS